MGWIFSLPYANVVGWLTAPRTALTEQALDIAAAHDFLMVFRYSRYDADQLGFVTDDMSCVRAMQDDAEAYAKRADWPGDPVEVVRQLHYFQRHFQRFRLFALAVGRSKEDYGRLRAFVEDKALRTGSRALFMIPNEWSMSPEIDLNAPFPALARCFGQGDGWPGIVFWTSTGASTYAPLGPIPRDGDADELWHLLRKALWSDHADGTVERILTDHASRRTKLPKLLHLSDLHFGTQEALEAQSYLLGCVEEIVQSEAVSRVVITGDLFNNPRKQDALAFNTFRQTIHRATGKDVVVVPGNHDQKLLGNFRWSLQQIADLEWSSLVVDENLRMVFFCFDSSKDADLARGAVTREQRLALASAFKTATVANSRVAQYLRIALLHHHPYSFQLPDAGLWRLFGKVGIREETFLRMTDGDDFVNWCSANSIPLILHGHKHVPYHAQGQAGNNAARRVDAVGCGSTTGVGGCPFSMNLLTWNGNTWVARFLMDPGDGSGFSEQRVVVRDSTMD